VNSSCHSHRGNNYNCAVAKKAWDRNPIIG